MGRDRSHDAVANFSEITCHKEPNDLREPDPVTHRAHDRDDDVRRRHLGHEQDDDLRRAFGARRLLRVASKMFGVPLKSMTPRLRAAVRARDRGRCVVQGCENFRFVDLHHHRARAKGGPNALENVYSLCTRHHRAVHEGLLSIEGSPSEGFVVRHAGGLLYGAPVVTEPQNRQSSEYAAA